MYIIILILLELDRIWLTVLLVFRTVYSYLDRFLIFIIIVFFELSNTSNCYAVINSQQI